MENLKLNNHSVTLVDRVEQILLNYLKEKNLRPGDPIPNEMELSAALGVARSVLREALSRLKMIGLIETRTRRGMILCEPSIMGGMTRITDPRILSEETLFHLLGFRIAMEIGMSSEIFRNITSQDIEELEEIVRVGTVFQNNEYAPISEYSFHSKLCDISRNKIIIDFQNIIQPIMIFVKEKFKDSIEPINIKLREKGDLITHTNLLEYLKNGDEAGYHNAIEKHFEVYHILMSQLNKQ